MKSLTAFSQVLIHEMGEWCGVSTVRDCKTVAERVEHEGISFLTISLSNFAKDFERSLDTGFVADDRFAGFQRSGGLPRFLGGFLQHVFDRGTGRLLDVPSGEAIYAIRQITRLMTKVNLPCSKEREQAALRRYVECEQEVRASDRSFVGPLRDDFERIGRMLWRELFTEVDFRVYHGDILPKHGGGSTADGIRGNAKYRQSEWTNRLEEYFPAGEYLFTRWSLYDPNNVNFLEPGAERPVKVITVPKTLKTPRIIAMEPTAMQYAQQAVLEAMSEATRANHYARLLICSDSQEPNRLLAREGSITGALATLDLSEASDRVSNQHVQALLANHPHLNGAVQACRSRKADVLGKTIRLAKFASMGSALCFPMEALVFCTIAFVGIERALKRRLTKEDIESNLGRVRVYGDDIIVPVDYVEHVVEALSSFGMKVNSDKSFWTGKFRESCGGDYYDGLDVTPIRVGELFPTRRGQAAEIVSTVALRNHLWKRGFVKSVEWLDDRLNRVLPVYPEVGPESRVLGRHVYGPPKGSRLDSRLHVPVVKGCYVETQLPKDPLSDYAALHKWFLKRGDQPFEDVNHLLRAGRSVSARIKNGWLPVS